MKMKLIINYLLIVIITDSFKVFKKYCFNFILKADKMNKILPYPN